MKFIQKILLLIFLIFTASAYAEEHLVFTVDLIRHGDRTPLVEIPNAPYLWKEGLGELTAEGMHQEFQLGSQLRKKYIEQYHLLPSNYSAETLYIRSTDINRTLVSAESFLLGLYPLGTGKITLPASYQPIPIHTVPKEQDYLLLVKPSKNIFLLMKLDFDKANFWKQESKPFSNEIEKWSKLTGLKIDSFSQLDLLYDNIVIRQLHHVSLPNGISAQDATNIHTLSNRATLEIFKHSELTYPMGHAFLTTTANYFKDATQKNTRLKSAIFFAHDASIMSLLNTLDSPIQIPKYASDLNFSLFENNQNYYVKIFLNNDPVIIPTCHKSNICSLSEFISLSEK